MAPNSAHQECRVELRSHTALFQHGSRGAGFSELRASAFRGAMRYWFRVFSRADVDGVRRLEGLVFGDRQAQRLTVRVHVAQPYKEIATRELRTLPHKEELPEALKGISAVKPGTRFTVTLTAAGDEGAFACAQWSLWLAVNLGGFGQRARRGAGSLVIESASGGVILPSPRGGTLDEFAAQLQTGVQQAAQCLERYRAAQEISEGAEVRYPTVAERLIVVRALGEGDEQEMRKRIMLSLRDFKDPAFGLPLFVDGKWAPGGRHASPLWIRLTALETGWAAVFTPLEPTPKGGAREKITEFLSSGSEERREIRW